ncbi:nSTAND1 domain-containing NTPase [Paractinoplanes rishiriensis]|nr:SUMF1/EgtB/PvdO family nonheme iron enzyme [Actinoplanes rishiriensis]
MAQGLPVFTVFLASPGDVVEERAIARDVVRRLQFDPFIQRHCSLRLVSWDEPAAPVPLLASEHPQHLIDDVLPRPGECDVVVAILWSRLGSPVPASPHPSGTAAEIDDALAGRPDVLIYRKTAEPTVALGAPDILERTRQYAAVRSYLAGLAESLAARGRGMFQEFGSPTDFRTLLDAHLRRLVERRTRSRPAAEAGRAERRWDTSRSPYPGLVAFTTADVDCFFGRDREVDALTARVRTTPLTVVLGASGSGKSSLIGAGLLPRLAALDGPTRWVTPTYDVERHVWHGPRVTPTGVGADPARWPAPVPDVGGRALVFVDQLEEIFGPPCAGYRDAFLDHLVAVADHGPATVVVSLRADFLGHALQHEGLARHLQAGSFLLGPPDLAAITEIIGRPAAVAGLRFDRELPEQLLIDARREPGRLPLLAFALNELHQRRSDDRLTAAAYAEIGGVAGALGRLAERTFGALPEGVRAEFGAVLGRLVAVDEVGGPVRARASVAALCTTAERTALVDALIAARLLVADATHVELAHEAVFRGWPRLAQWIDSVHEDMLTLQRLRRAVAEWLQSGRDTAFLWPQPRMDATLAAAGRIGAELRADERSFLRPEAERLCDELRRSGLGHRRRQEISVQLARLGDRRPGIGVAADGRPDIEWCRVPGDQPLWIAKHPVTVAQLDAFRRSHYRPDVDGVPTGLEKTAPNLPATCSRREAMTFVSWANKGRTAGGPVVRLPTRAEWERAAGGRTYPWGDDWRDDHANTIESGLGGTLAVGMYPAGAAPCGALDMAGTVWEWCDDESAPGHRVPDDLHLLKGGSAWEKAATCQVTGGRRMRGDVARDDAGIRLVLVGTP